MSINRLSALTLMLLFGLLSVTAHAADQQALQTSNMKHKEGFIAIKNIDGVHSVTFHIMRAPDGTGYSHDEYHVMVSIEKNGKPLHGLQVSSQVIHPDGSTGGYHPMVELDGWYMARFRFGHDRDRHLVSVRFSDGDKSYVSSISYPE